MLTSHGETLVLDTLLAGVWVSLHIHDPTDDGLYEVVGGAYVRQSCTFGNYGSNPMSAKNTSAIVYAMATADWGIVNHFGLWDAETGGTFLAYAEVTTPKPVEVDDTVRWEINSLIITTD